MTVTSVEIRDSFGESFPLFDLERTRDALAKYVELRWPRGRRNAVAREWALSDDEARPVCSGHASWATFDKIIRHKRGGWSIIFPVFGALLNETAEHFIMEKRKAHAEHAERLGALVGDWWPMGPDRHSADPGSGRVAADRVGASSRRATEEDRRQSEVG